MSESAHDSESPADRDEVTILLVDDHQLFRDALRGMLGAAKDLRIIGEVGDGEAAIQAARDLQPDVILMDISMPGMNGIEATRTIQTENPDTRIVVLSMHADKRFVLEALKAGASGYYLKDSSGPELEDGVRGVARGEFRLCPSISSTVIRDYIQISNQEDASAYNVLSDRERQVLQLLAEGLAAKTIAARLHISVKTAESHRARIMAKLDLHSIAELTKYAVREGLTSLDP